MKVLVCGSRYWEDSTMVGTVLDGIADNVTELTVIEGGAPGADTHAGTWIDRRIYAVPPVPNFVQHLQYPAEWDVHGKAAGPIRNQKMLDLGPDLVLAFKDDLDPELKKGGTEDMVRRSIKAGVNVWHLHHLKGIS